MGWREQLLPASFRNVPFFVDSHNGEFGRRVDVHEYVQQDDVEVEDLGGRAPRVLVDGYVIGEDYFAGRDQLLDALSQTGSGRLVHPYRGTFDAQVISYRLSESTREGGLARLQMEFIQAGDVSRPQVVADTRRVVRLQAATADVAAEAEFSQSWLQQVAGAVDAAVDAVTDAVRTVERLIDNAVATEDEIANLIGTPDRIYERLALSLRRIRSLATLRRLFGYQARASSTARTAVASAAAVTTTVRAQVSIAAAELSASLTFPSYDEAIAIRDELIGQMDAAAANAGDDLFEALQALRARMVEDISTRAADLSRITHYELAETLPAIVIAHRLYGSGSGFAALLVRADDIVARNGVLHPGFVQGGQSLEVLSD